MDSNVCKNIIVKILFFISIILSFLLILYAFQYNVLIYHDLSYDSYGMPFLKPDHGRYVASFLNNIFTDIIPSLLNLHPNTFVKYAVNPLKAILIILFCLILANSFFIFKREEKDILKFDFGNIAFYLLYIILFFTIFNYSTYLFLSQNTLFWGNFLCLFYYVIFLNLLIYYLVNPEYCEKSINNRNYILLLIFAFLTGISHEAFNVPVAFVLSIYFIYFLFNKKKFSKEMIKKIMILCGVYILSLICFYIHPNDNPFLYGEGTYKDYLINEFSRYLFVYFYNFCLHKVLFFTIPIFILFILIYLNSKNRNIVFFILINLLSIYLFYFALFFLGYDFNEKVFYLSDSDNKFINTYNTIALYLFILTLGYYIDKCIKSNKKDLIKVYICIFVLVIFSKHYLIANYKQNLDGWVYSAKTTKTLRYIVEKIAINQQEGDKIVLPEEIGLSTGEKIKITEHRALRTFNGMLSNLRLVHPELAHKKETVYEGTYLVNENLYAEHELEELDFQKLLISRMPKRKYKIWAKGHPREEI